MSKPKLLEGHDARLVEITIEVPYEEVGHNAAWLRIRRRADEVIATNASKVDSYFASKWLSCETPLRFGFKVFDMSISGTIVVTSEKVIVSGNCPTYLIKTVQNYIREEVNKVLKR